MHATTEFLERFFSNLLMGTKYELKNRYMHVDYVEEDAAESQSAKIEVSKCKNCTLECTMEELAIMKILKENPSITQKKLAKSIEKSERTVKDRMINLQEKNYIRRVNGKRYGKWEVLVEIE